MPIFPTQYSTLSAAALQQFIGESYELTGIACGFKLRGVSDTYTLDSNQGKIFLKVFRKNHRSKEELQGEIELLQYLHQQQIRVAAPLADKFGNKLQAFEAAEGIRYGILYHAAPGRPVIEQSDEQIIQSGAYLAKLHLQYQYENFEDTTNVFFGARFLRERIQLIRKHFEMDAGAFC